MKYWIFTYAFLVVFSVKAQIIIDEQNINKGIFINPYASIYDRGEVAPDENRLWIDSTQKQPSRILQLNTGFTNHYYTIQFAVNNTTNQTLTYFLETGRPITDEVNLYELNGNSKLHLQQTGDLIPFNQRAFPSRRSVFKITIQPNTQKRYVLQLKSDGEVINMATTLYTVDEFVEESSTEQLIYGLFYGLILLAGIAYLFFYFALKEISFLYYSFYVWSAGLMQFSIDGLYYEIFAPMAGIWSAKSVLIFAGIGASLLLKYSQNFLRVNNHLPRLNNIYNLMLLANALFLAGFIMYPQILPISYPLMNILGLLSLFLTIYTIFRLQYKGIHVDYYFTAGFICLVSALTIFILNNFGIIPNSFFTHYSSKFGTGIEVIFLSLSMSNLIRKLKSEKEIAQTIALKKSEDMNELKSYFMNNMSHELRTPLNAIMGISDMLLQSTTNAEVKENLSVIKYSSHNLLSSVNDVLDFSKIERGELTLEKTAFETQKAFDQIKFYMQKQAIDKGLLFTWNVASPLPVELIGDANRLIQILNNVISNAIKFTSHGRVEVTITVNRETDKQVVLCIEVKDSGIGIPKEKMDTIYEAFTQESMTHKRKFGGLGLGLTIVKKLVDLYNGKININSTPGVGTTCMVQLPFEINAFSSVTLLSDSAITATDDNINILIVEDNALNQLIMKKVLSKEVKFSFRVANHGAEALTLMQQQQFDIVLMDLQMPVMDGYECTLAIREGKAGNDYQQIPIIAITADVMEGTKSRTKEIGMNAYLSKPFNHDELLQLIKELTAINQVEV
ncbi:MAG: ATP-binding protein [Bacteroidia bacterium]|jgi:signal transduction histidine kinase/ActR/RegA family two-component response regulator|nr:ATP-binding protein [Bacteroidia bacterium]